MLSATVVLFYLLLANIQGRSTATLDRAILARLRDEACIMGILSEAYLDFTVWYPTSSLLIHVAFQPAVAGNHLSLANAERSRRFSLHHGVGQDHMLSKEYSVACFSQAVIRGGPLEPRDGG